MRIRCPGYRDPLEQKFRDESVKVKQKAQRSYTKNAKPKEDQETLHASDVSVISPWELDGTLLVPPQRRLESRVEEVALSHFMSSYVPGSRFHYLMSMYAGLGPDASLQAAIDAASKARFAWEIREPLMMATARSSYAKALAETNLALSNPATALQDSTLISVLLLSLFESMIWAGTGVPDNWTAHAQGALALVRMRGKRQLDTELGRLLFIHVTNITSVNSIRLRQRLPQDIIDLQREALRRHDDEHPLYRITSYTGEVTNWLADAGEGNMTTNQIISSARMMDDKYAAFLEALSPTCGDCSLLEEEDAWPSRRTVHDHYAPRTAQMLNSLRMTRLLLNEILCGHASLVSPAYAADIKAQAEKDAKQMAIDICETAKHFMKPKKFNLACMATLLWPLSSVRVSALAPQEAREFAEQTIKRLGDRLFMPGTRNVDTPADTTALGEITVLEDGLHMYYLS